MRMRFELLDAGLLRLEHEFLRGHAPVVVERLREQRFAGLLILDEARVGKRQLGDLKSRIIEQGDIRPLVDDIGEELLRLVVIGLDARIFGRRLLRADISQRPQRQRQQVLAVENGRARGEFLQAAFQRIGRVFVIADLIQRERLVVEGRLRLFAVRKLLEENIELPDGRFEGAPPGGILRLEFRGLRREHLRHKRQGRFRLVGRDVFELRHLLQAFQRSCRNRRAKIGCSRAGRWLPE